MADFGTDAGVVRAVALLGPIAATALLWLWRSPDQRLAAGALLATVWNLAALLGVHVAAGSAEWWRYEATGGLLLGMPVDLLILDAAVGRHPGARLPEGPGRRTGGPAVPARPDAHATRDHRGARRDVADWEVAGLVTALLLGRWTAAKHRLAIRATMQVALAGALLLWVLQLMVLQSPWGLLAALADFAWPLRYLAIAVLLVVAVPGVAAVHEFTERGTGSGWRGGTRPRSSPSASGRRGVPTAARSRHGARRGVPARFSSPPSCGWP